MQHRRLFVAFAFLAGILIGLASSMPVSAHHPEISASTDCLTDDGWTVKWTVAPDRDRPELTWKVLDPDGYSPTGSQPALTVNVFVKTVTYPVDQAYATEEVEVQWSNRVTSTRFATIERPNPCPTTTTSTTTSTVPPTSSSVPPSTSTPTTTVTSTPTTTTAAPSTTTTAPSTVSTTLPTPPTTDSPDCTTGTIVDDVCQPVGCCEQGPPPTYTPPVRVTQPPPVPELPETGPEETERLLTIATLTAVLGGLLVLTARRRLS